jgi:DNA repair protein RecN (Recombination protein N)
MLKYLKIENFAIIKSLHLEFPAGMIVLTGETGAGKSILVDAMEFLLGGKASQDCIRTGEEGAVVEGIFAARSMPEILELLLALGIDHEGEVILKREIFRDGRNRVFINGSLNTRKNLKQVGILLADIHGQHDHQMLLHAENHLAALDAFGQNEGSASAVGESFTRIEALRKKLSALTMDSMEKERRIDFLRHQIGEIDGARLSPGEDQELKKEKLLLTHAARITEIAEQGHQILYEGEHAVDSQLRLCIKLLEELQEFDEGAGKHLAQAEEARYSVEDAAFYLRDFAKAQRFDPDRLEAIESRLSEIDRLRLKYGSTLEAILAFRAEAQKELDQICLVDEEKEALEKELAEEIGRYQKAADALSARRSRDARKLEKRMEAELAELAMARSRFCVSLATQGDPGSTVSAGGVPVAFFPSGYDCAEFLLSANPGEDPKPLARIASGGEISRIMLALKTVIASGLGRRLMILDELDAGIGGRVAEAVGRKMQSLARGGQVFCVTHLSQIASLADAHFVVSKHVREGHTEVTVSLLKGEPRVREIARMLGGRKITRLAIEHAHQVLTEGQKSD